MSPSSGYKEESYSSVSGFAVDISSNTEIKRLEDEEKRIKKLPWCDL